MQWLFEIDDLLLGIAERFAHWFQRLTGKNNFFLARTALGLMALSLVGELYDIVSKGVITETRWYIDFFQTGLFVSMLVWGYANADYKALRRLSEGLKNPLKIHPFFKLCRSFFTVSLGAIRLMLMCALFGAFLRTGKLSSLKSGTWYMDTLEIGLIAYVYFDACDPLPPCGGKFQDLLTNIFGKKALGTSTN